MRLLQVSELPQNVHCGSFIVQQTIKNSQDADLETNHQ